MGSDYLFDNFLPLISPDGHGQELPLDVFRFFLVSQP
jgi:hypothetical protein